MARYSDSWARTAHGWGMIWVMTLLADVVTASTQVAETSAAERQSTMTTIGWSHNAR